MNKILGFLLLVLTASAVIGQHNIEFDIQNYDQDTIIIGYYLIDKQLVYDTIYPDDTGKYVLQGDENLESGVYMMLTVPEREFIQFLVSDTEQNFKVSFSADQLGTLKFENAPDNKQLNDYVDFLKKVRPQADVLRDTIAKLKEEGKDITKFQEELSLIDKSVMEYQDKVYSEHPEYISSQMLKANREIIVPDFSNAPDPNMARYEYYRSHYFDNINLDNPASLRTPYLYQRVNYYINKLTPNHPDSICIAIDHILGKMKPAPETFKFYLSHFLNEYAASKIVGFDAVYVHLVDKYYANGKATWVEQDNLDKIIKRANDIKPTLIGEIGADLTVYGQDDKPITISELDYEYLILLFWAPDCGHCKKSMPDYVKFNEKWESKGVKTLAVCTKHQDKTKTCWEAIEDKEMGGFINAADQYHRSKFKIKYNVTSTPKLFILDKNREIILKNIGSDQLDEVMSEVIKMEKMKEEQN